LFSGPFPGQDCPRVCVRFISFIMDLNWTVFYFIRLIGVKSLDALKYVTLDHKNSHMGLFF